MLVYQRVSREVISSRSGNYSGGAPQLSNSLWMFMVDYIAAVQSKFTGCMVDISMIYL